MAVRGHRASCSTGVFINSSSLPFSAYPSVGVYCGCYRYTGDLLAMESTGITATTQSHQQSVACATQDFLPLEAWEPFPITHPDQAFADYLCRGMRSGFRIGFDPKAVKLKQCSRNLKSVSENPSVVDEYLRAELETGKIRLHSSESKLNCSPIGIVPKPHQPGKFRLIVDLSAPKGQSVNDGISQELFLLNYTSVDEATELVMACGKGALMAKLDLRSAYRMVPVHPDDQVLLGLKWNSNCYIDQALPFGLRSAPKIFTVVADGLTWALIRSGISNVLHYLDDFFFCSAHQLPDCQYALNTAIPLCQQLGLPVAPHKVEKPSTSIQFLGIEIDSQSQQLRLLQ